MVHFAGYLLQFRSSLIAELVRRGYETHVIVPGLTPPLEAALAALGARSRGALLERTGLNPLRDLAYRRELDAAIRAIAPEVAIANGIKPIVHGMPAAAAAGVRVRCPLFAGLGALRPAGMKQRILSMAMQPLVRRALAASTHVATQNIDDAALLQQRFGAALPGAPIVTEGSGVDLRHYPQAPVPAEPMVLMTARLVVEKGIYEFCDAAKIVRARRPGTRFVLAGFFEGSRAGAAGRDEFLARCRDAGVEYAGHLADVRPLLRECTVFALPTYYGEGRPRSIQEALSTGRPIVTTDNVGCRDSIEESVHGRIVPPRDAAALARAIDEVLGWPEREALAARCRAYAERRYCARQIAADFLDALGVAPVAVPPPAPGPGIAQPRAAR